MKKLFIIIFLILFLPSLIWATSYTRYIDPDCGTPGTGINSTCTNDADDAWDDPNDFNDFVEGTMIADDTLTVYVKKGTTTSSKEAFGWDGDDLTWPASGSVTIDAYNAGADPIFDVETMRFLKINASTGVDFTIKNVEVYDRESSTYFFPIFFANVTGDITIEYITGNGEGDGSGTNPQNFIRIQDCTGNVTIHHNTIHTIGPATIPTEDGDGHAILVQDTDGLGDGTPASLKIHNNTIYNIQSDAIQIINCEFGGSGDDKLQIYDNDFDNYGENAIDLKGVLYYEIYRNDFENDAFNGGGSGKGEHIVLHVGGTTATQCNYGDIYNNNFGENSDTSGKHYSVAVLAAQSSGGLDFRDNWIENCTYIYFHTGLLRVWNNIWRATEIIDASDGKLRVFYIDSTVTAGSTLYHNAVYDLATDGTIVHGIYVDDGDIVIKNNMIWLQETGDVYGLYDVNSNSPTADYNRYHNPNDTSRVHYNGTAYTTANFSTYTGIAGHTNEESAAPLWTDPANGDFTLTASIPGEDTGATYDLSWDPRTSLPPTALDYLSRDSLEQYDKGPYSFDDVGEATSEEVILSTGSNSTLATGTTMTLER